MHQVCKASYDGHLQSYSRRYHLLTFAFPSGKAANAGGVAVSGLEMAQNSQRIAWSAEEVDSKLKSIMESCFKNGLETAKEYVEPAEGEFPSLVAGSNIAGFSKVAAAMRMQGDWW